LNFLILLSSLFHPPVFLLAILLLNFLILLLPHHPNFPYLISFPSSPFQSPLPCLSLSTVLYTSSKHLPSTTLFSSSLPFPLTPSPSPPFSSYSFVSSLKLFLSSFCSFILASFLPFFLSFLLPFFN
jgi:hypothetical protein